MGQAHTVRVDSATARRADLGDARAVADVLIRSRQAAAGAIPAAVHPDAETREWISAVVIPEREVWLMEGVDSRPLGLQLWTFVTNTRAQRFYLRHGFIAAETDDGSGNEEKAPAIRFVWTAL
jgi:hypothetical protein